MTALLHSVGRKTALAVGLPVLLATALGIGLSWRKAREILAQNAAEEATLLADMTASAFALVDPGAAPPGAAGFKGHPHRQVDAVLAADYQVLENVGDLRIVNRNGVVRWSRRIEEVGTVRPDAARLLAAPPQGINGAGGEHIRPLGGLSCARCHGGNAFKMGAVQALVPHPRLSESVERLFGAVAVFFLVLFGGLLAVIVFSMRRLVTLPLGRLISVMQRAEGGDFLVRAETRDDDEIGRLAGAFNSMLARITEMKVAEIETSRELESMQRELALKAELERQHHLVEKANRALAKKVQEVTLLLDIGRSLNSTLELTEILQAVTEMIGVTIGVDQFTVMLLDERSDTLQIASSWGFRQREMNEFRLPVGEGASGIAVKNREPVYVSDLSSDSRYLKGPYDPRGEGSVLSVPMICKEKVVGALNFVRFVKNGFSENDVMLLRLVATQAAMAIVNARLFTETKELTLTDALTGVFNRRHLFARLEMEFARAQRFLSPISVVMLDLDHFKQLNDTRGHSCGDSILREAANVLRRTIRKVDTVARYGGEEFMVVLPTIACDAALEVAEKLRRAIEKTDFPGAETQPGGRITVSAGVASFPDDALTVEALIDAADAALYASKRAGRNRATLFKRGMELEPGRSRPTAKSQLEESGERDSPARKAS